jgi:hypothetical protein
MCRALKVLCVAEDAERLSALQRASVGAAWELCPGATDVERALEQLDAERPQRLVVFGPFEDLIVRAGQRYPGMVIVSDRDAPGAMVAASLQDVRGLLEGMPRPGGPVGA